jgi:hypothetical protein
LLEGDLLASVLERTPELIDTSGLRQSEPQTARALEELANETAESMQPIILGDASAIQPSVGAIKVIMPGSRGVNIQRNNEEFEVQRIFFSPTLQAVAYRGRHEATTVEEVVEIVRVDDLVPIAGESKLGTYDPETGDLVEIGIAV